MHGTEILLPYKSIDSQKDLKKRAANVMRLMLRVWFDPIEDFALVRETC